MQVSIDRQSSHLPIVKDNNAYAIVWPSQPHVMAKVVNFMQDSGAAFEVDHEGGFLIVNIDDTEKFVICLRDTISMVEAVDTRVLLCDTKTPTLGAFKNVFSLSQLVDRVNNRWLIEMLDDRRYVSYAQPIVTADGNWDVVAHEFLLRGINREEVLVPPDRLFGAAKAPELLRNLDQKARINAISTAARRPDSGDVFINFLPSTVYDPSVCLQKTVAAALHHGVANNRIVIEIVESHQIGHFDHVREIVAFFRSVGFRVALDDFGTGFNNLDTYIALNPDFIKLDKSLSSNLTDDDPRLGMVKGIVRTARSSGIKIVAEGIETATNARVVSDCGVDRMQGYFFGRPAPVEQAPA